MPFLELYKLADSVYLFN